MPDDYKTLAEETLDAMEKQIPNMTPEQLAHAEETFGRITEEVRKNA